MSDGALSDGERYYLRGCKPGGAVEIVPGHQSACFAGERQEKRGLK